MRRTGYLLLLPLVLALGGFAHAPARTPLTVNGVYCQAYTTWRFSCVADVSGGTGAYNSFDWSWEQSGAPTGTAWTYVNEVEGNCAYNGLVIVTVTVRDSNWDTATGSGGFYCTYD